MRAHLLFLLLPVALSAQSDSVTLAHLPNKQISAVKVDSAGNIYVAGHQSLGVMDTWDGFVAKLSPDASKVFYSTTFAGSESDFATALAIDDTGAAYISGTTYSPDFPVTPGVLQTNFQAPPGSSQAFAAKVDAQGKVVYSTFLGGSSGNSGTVGGILVNGAGEAVISGRTFVTKLDVNGANSLGSVAQLGGILASDTHGDIYVAGIWNSSSAFPATPGAFQSTFQGHPCGGGGMILFGCNYQYLAKLNGNLTQVLYATLLAGTYGATPAAILVDGLGQALVAGTTNSPDYPTTGNALQPLDHANAPPPPELCGPHGCTFSPPPASGYVTRLNAGGTGLVYSTFFSGTQTDTITFASMTSSGVSLAGTAGSADLPGLNGVPSACLPENFATQMSLNGSTVSATRMLPGTVLAYDARTATYIASKGTDLIRFDPAVAPPAISCVLDAADLQPVTSIVPGELLALFGPQFTAGTYIEPLTSLPRSQSGVSVAFNGTAGPLLYVSPQQLNVQVPFEVATSPQAALDLTLSADRPVADSRVFPVVAASPTAFLNSTSSLANNTCVNGSTFDPLAVAPLAFNSDSTPNTCLNPASSGTTVMVFLQGFGITGPAVTGGVNASPGPPLPLSVTATDSSGAAVNVVSANALAGSLNGVWQVGVQIASARPGATGVLFSLQTPSGAVPVRERLNIWWK